MKAYINTLPLAIVKGSGITHVERGRLKGPKQHTHVDLHRVPFVVCSWIQGIEATEHAADTS